MSTTASATLQGTFGHRLPAHMLSSKVPQLLCELVQHLLLVVAAAVSDNNTKEGKPPPPCTWSWVIANEGRVPQLHHANWQHHQHG